MMLLASSIKCQITTQRTPEEISERLGAVTEFKETASRAEKAPFAGNVSPYGFCITPVLPYRNSFLPFLTGTFSVAGSETVISVTARMHPFTRMLVFLWFGMFSLVLLFGLPAVLAGELKMLWLPLCYMGAAWVMIRCFFHAPAKKAIEALRELLA